MPQARVWLRERLSGWGDAPALVWHGRTLSYAALLVHVDEWVADLQSRGVRAGQVVLIEGVLRESGDTETGCHCQRDLLVLDHFLGEALAHTFGHHFGAFFIDFGQDDEEFFAAIANR